MKGGLRAPGGRGAEPLNQQPSTWRMLLLGDSTSSLPPRRRLLLDLGAGLVLVTLIGLAMMAIGVDEPLRKISVCSWAAVSVGIAAYRYIRSSR